MLGSWYSFPSHIITHKEYRETDRFKKYLGGRIFRLSGLSYVHSEGEGEIANDWGPFGVKGTKLVHLAGMVGPGQCSCWRRGYKYGKGGGENKL